MNVERRLMEWRAMGLSLLVALAGPFGCDDNDDDAAVRTTVVLTNQVTGAVTTNVVVVTEEEEEVLPAENPPAAALDVTGEWNGTYRSRLTGGHLELDLRQNGADVVGQACIQPDAGPTGVGSVRGTLNDFVMNLEIQVETWFMPVELDHLPDQAAPPVNFSGQVSANGRSYEGDMASGAAVGTFALQR
jgi:hypothetical protein